MKAIITLCLLSIPFFIYSQEKVQYKVGSLTYWEFDKYHINNFNSGESIYLGKGAGASASNLSSLRNIFIGQDAGFKLVSGTDNIGIGFKSLAANQAGRNIAIGNYIIGGTNSLDNVFIGDSTGYANNSLKNVFLGNKSGLRNYTGSGNVFIGYEAGYGASGNDVDAGVFIGNRAGYFETNDHKLYISNSDTDQPLIGGDFATKQLDFHGRINVNDKYKLPDEDPAIGAVMMNTTSFNQLHFSPYVFPTNQGNSSQILKLSNSGLLTWQNDLYEDADADPANEKISSMSLSNNLLNVFEGNDVHFVNLSPYVNHWVKNVNDLYYDQGDLGVGNNNPLARLHVESTTGNTPLMVEIANNIKLLVNPNGGTAIGAAVTPPENGLYVLGDLNVGTSIKRGKMHIHDGANELAEVHITPKANSVTRGDSAMIFLSEDAISRDGMYWLYDGKENHMELWGKSSSTLYGPHLTVERNNGNIAIGNIFDDGYRLTVDGKISCEELKIEDSGNWPDFVFKENYPLKKLSEVKSHIETNGHLPDIPSAKEINGKGFSTGTMIEKLLVKIEELTLHTIRQQEEIDSLKKHLVKSAEKN